MSTNDECCETCGEILIPGGPIVPEIDYNGAWHLYCSKECRDGIKMTGEEPDIVY